MLIHIHENKTKLHQEDFTGGRTGSSSAVDELQRDHQARRTGADLGARRLPIQTRTRLGAAQCRAQSSAQLPRDGDGQQGPIDHDGRSS
ncbi:hypothetical protein N6H18_11650 [Reichenbachiella agarivorans]|uniref:Uncharacterized protein n=1 Tax=Reichenbachiella agarivorans TaxID=2979464 RepID=A0ABY6CMM7_9BACT|nr:hypothetical protein [Reichenbachiella agarivorans]UXP31004.1 hypothetical protein N6H18_11650 [Reichenbachiella agarivorans]